MSDIRLWTQDRHTCIWKFLWMDLWAVNWAPVVRCCLHDLNSFYRSPFASFTGVAFFAGHKWWERPVYYWSSCSRLLLTTITFSVCCATFHIPDVRVLLLLHLVQCTDILYGSTEAFSNVMQSSQNTCVYLLLMFVVHEGAWRCRGEICKRSNYWIWWSTTRL